MTLPVDPRRTPASSMVGGGALRPTTPLGAPLLLCTGGSGRSADSDELDDVDSRRSRRPPLPPPLLLVLEVLREDGNDLAGMLPDCARGAAGGGRVLCGKMNREVFAGTAIAGGRCSAPRPAGDPAGCIMRRDGGRVGV